ncbi:hypothetical protein EKH57_02290 [Halorubrum sp. BOL3-1]|uniref:hypothetical protein n=1 Tax=Halorubrum sp. BOL3-1 TaxID=2497325 RepID=UPI0010051303|nr:hypothetical protein [Halorubrum sp. BOL3-1]QAU11684.1 hypothetical protein EKH57_02290 [Halorubrum sp. BOL3-1]
MTRDAAKSGFDAFLTDAVDATRAEFSVERALRGTGLGPGGAVVDRLRSHADALERRVVEPELAAYRDDALAQFDVILRYARDDDPIDAYADELVARDGFYDALADGVPERTATAVEEAVVERCQRLGDAVRPIVTRPEDEFWPAVTAAFDSEEAAELVENAFPFTGVLRDFRSAFVFEARIDPGEVLGGPFATALPSVSVEYTDEAKRAMLRAERRVIEETKREVATRFDSG